MALTIEAPSAAEYERGLPDGWGSFADCQVKAALVRAAASETALLEAELPAPLRALVDDPPLVTAWVPEVLHVGLVLALHEALVREDRAAGFLDWVAERHRELLAGAYAPTVRGPKGERMLKALPAAWERFHRGTEMMIDGLEGDTASVLLSSPPGLYPAFVSQMQGTALRVVLEVSGARDVSVRHRLQRPGLVAYDLSWST